jgi:hypothetical protein
MVVTPPPFAFARARNMVYAMDMKKALHIVTGCLVLVPFAMCAIAVNAVDTGDFETCCLPIRIAGIIGMVLALAVGIATVMIMAIAAWRFCLENV